MPRLLVPPLLRFAVPLLARRVVLRPLVEPDAAERELVEGEDAEREAVARLAVERFAVEAFVESVRHFIGAYLVVLGGCDVLVFTGGIGENGVAIRQAVCRDLEWAGIALDLQKNQVRGKETKISQVESAAEIWVIPTNEELIVARQTVAVLTAN